MSMKLLPVPCVNLSFPELPHLADRKLCGVLHREVVSEVVLPLKSACDMQMPWLRLFMLSRTWRYEERRESMSGTTKDVALVLLQSVQQRSHSPSAVCATVDPHKATRIRATQAGAKRCNIRSAHGSWSRKLFLCVHRAGLVSSRCAFFQGEWTLTLTAVSETPDRMQEEHGGAMEAPAALSSPNDVLATGIAI